MTTHANAEIALMGQVLQIFKAFDEEFPKEASAGLAHREGGPNPYYNRTSSGLYLEFYYGTPSRLWTPWGQWHICGSVTRAQGVSNDEQNAGFLARLTIEVARPLKKTEMGEFGPTYKVLALDGVPLPEPGEIEEFHLLPSDGFAEAKEHWEGLMAMVSTKD